MCIGGQSQALPYDSQGRVRPETMRKRTSLRPRFVRSIPADGRQIEEGYLYIALQYNTIVHRCPCGCGGLSEIGLGPGLRTIEYDGEKVSLWPSIGARALKCRSHYWVRKNEVVWATELPEKLDTWYEAKRREAQDKRRRQIESGPGVARGLSGADADPQEGDGGRTSWVSGIVPAWLRKAAGVVRAVVMRQQKGKQ